MLFYVYVVGPGRRNEKLLLFFGVINCRLSKMWRKYTNGLKKETVVKTKTWNERENKRIKKEEKI
jgi:hypothetical protein